MKELLELIAPAVGVDVAVLEEKLKTPEGVAEIMPKLKDARVLTPTQQEELFTNKLKSFDGKALFAIIPENTKKGLHNIYKGSVLDSHEATLQEKYGTSFVKGTDFNTADELIAKIIETKAPAGAGEKDKTIQNLQKELQAWPVKLQEAITAKTTEYENHLQGHEHKVALSVISQHIDSDEESLPEKLSSLNLLFNAKYTLTKDSEGKYQVMNKDGQPAVDKDYKPLTLDAVYMKLAGQLFSLVSDVPKTGRGANDPAKKNKGGASKDFSKYQSSDEFFTALSGEGLRVGTPEHSARVKEFIAARPDLKI